MLEYIKETIRLVVLSTVAVGGGLMLLVNADPYIFIYTFI